MPKSKERCEEIRNQMRDRILKQSLLYFAKNGFSGTRISDLASYIGIAQGTLYLYFESKEELFSEVRRLLSEGDDLKQLKLLTGLPVTAKRKIHMLSEAVLKRLEEDSLFAASVTVRTQLLLEQGAGAAADATAYQSEWYLMTEKIVRQGQREGDVVQGSPMKLTDYYWGVVYLYALKKLFTSRYERIGPEDLERTLLNGR